MRRRTGRGIPGEGIVSGPKVSEKPACECGTVLSVYNTNGRGLCASCNSKLIAAKFGVSREF